MPLGTVIQERGRCDVNGVFVSFNMHQNDIPIPDAADVVFGVFWN